MNYQKATNNFNRLLRAPTQPIQFDGWFDMQSDVGGCLGVILIDEKDGSAYSKNWPCDLSIAVGRQYSEITTAGLFLDPDMAMTDDLFDCVKQAIRGRAEPDKAQVILTRLLMTDNPFDYKNLRSLHAAVVLLKRPADSSNPIFHHTVVRRTPSC